MKFSAEYAISAINRDTRIQNELLNASGITKFLIAPTTAVSYNSAINGSISFPILKTKVQLKYRRIDPEYQTLGIPFMNNDLEDGTLNLSRQLFKNKMNLALSGGIQRNNLSRTQENTTQRYIGSINMGYAITEGFMIGANYANFTTNTTKIQIDGLDSLNYYQVTENAGFNAAYAFGKKTIKTRVSANFTYQNATGLNGGVSEVYNYQAMYGVNLTEKGINASLGFNVNQNSFVGEQSIGLGPIANSSFTVLKEKVKVNFNFSALNFKTNGVSINKSTNLSSGLSYSIKKHSFGLTYAYLLRSIPEQDLRIRENRIAFNYSVTLKSYKLNLKKG